MSWLAEWIRVGADEWILEIDTCIAAGMLFLHWISLVVIWVAVGVEEQTSDEWI